MNTKVAVGELIGAAFKFYGGKGDAGAVVIGHREHRENNMQIYIAGKITGLDESEAFEAFALAERFITDKGHEPLNPMKLVDQAGDRAYEDYLLDALEIVLCSAQAMYMLDGWRSSLGARIEHAIAVEKKLPIFYQGSEIWD